MHPKALARMPKNSRGFTLIEITMSMIVLSLCAGMIMSSMVTAKKWTQPQKNVGANIARAEIEQLQNAVRADWWDNPGEDLSPGTYDLAPIVRDGKTYQGTYTVTDVPDTDFRKVVMTVTYEDQDLQ